MITLDLSILNQKGTPMFYSDIFANRPAAGVVGRIFISTDTYEFYRDTGSAWDAIGGSGSGITGSGTAGTLPIWTGSSVLGDSTLLEGSTKFTTTKDFQSDAFYLNNMTAGNGALYYNVGSDILVLANYNVAGNVKIEANAGQQAVYISGSDLSSTFSGYVAATPTLTAANNASSLASYGINTLSYAAGFSSNNIGALYGGIAGFNLQTFAGSATFAQANVASGGASVNSIDFISAGSTITMTQAAGIRVMSGQQNLFQYQGTNSGTITHAAISQNTGFYRPAAASGILTITNAYSLLLNALDDYGAGFTFTNRWGIYQAGASDKNYFAANMLLGSTTDNGNRLQVFGSCYIGTKLGIAVTPFNWSIGNTIDIANGVSILSFANESYFSNNAYFDSGWKYKASSFANYYVQNSSGQHAWFNAASGIAGNGISFTQVMTMDANGNLIVGDSATSDSAKLYIKKSLGSSDFATNAGLFLNVGSESTTANLIRFNGAVAKGLVFGRAINADNFIWGFTNSTTPVMTLDSSGNLLFSTTSLGATGISINNQKNISFSEGSGDSYANIFRQRNTAAAVVAMGYKRSTTSSFASSYGISLSRAAIVVGDNNGSIAFYSDPANNIPNGTDISVSPKVTIFNDGNTSIGSTSNTGNKLYLNGSLRIDGQSSGTAGGSSGQHLIINLDGTTYKIALLNP